MKKFDSGWKNNDSWKTRYKHLYSIQSRRPSDTQSPRISFMSDYSTPYSTFLLKLSQCDTNSSVTPSTPHLESGNADGRESSLPSLGVNDTLLLNMVCSHNREVADEVPDVPELPRGEDLENILSQDSYYGYGTSMGMRTERSISRSRVSRMSTRRNMDIPSILAFTANDSTPVHIAHPAFQKIDNPQAAPPRWSIRRSVCPVCSQKWRDRSSIYIIKNSGLKRNLASEQPSVIIPARLRSSITMGYKSPTIRTVVEENSSVFKTGTRRTSTSWQLTRARRLRMPQPQVPSPEATAPPKCSAPMARKDLDSRISKFLSDDF